MFKQVSCSLLHPDRDALQIRGVQDDLADLYTSKGYTVTIHKDPTTYVGKPRDYVPISRTEYEFLLAVLIGLGILTLPLVGAILAALAIVVSSGFVFKALNTYKIYRYKIYLREYKSAVDTVTYLYRCYR